MATSFHLPNETKKTDLSTLLSSFQHEHVEKLTRARIMVDDLEKGLTLQSDLLSTKIDGFVVVSVTQLEEIFTNPFQQIGFESNTR